MGSQKKRTAIYQTNNLSNSNALEHSQNFLSATSPGMPITQKQHTCVHVNKVCIVITKSYHTNLYSSQLQLIFFLLT